MKATTANLPKFQQNRALRTEIERLFWAALSNNSKVNAAMDSGPCWLGSESFFDAVMYLIDQYKTNDFKKGDLK